MSESTGPPASGQGESSSGAQEKAQQAAGQVQEKAQEVAGQAQEKAMEAADRAQGMVREQIDQRSSQAGEKVSETASSLRTVSEELRKQGQEAPAKLAEKAAERGERLSSYLAESDGDKMLSDVEDLGRRRPLAVLAGGLVVGMAAARFLKASSRSRYQSRAGLERPTRELTPEAPAPPPTPAEPVGAGGSTGVAQPAGTAVGR